MNLLQAIVLGIVQGLTEFLPISSTAHLRVVPALCGWADPGAAFTAVIQIGTLLAVIVYFYRDLSRALSAWASSFGKGKAKSPEAKLGWAVFWGTIPIILFGVLFKDYIKGEFRSIFVIAWSLIVVGILMGLAEISAKHRRKLPNVQTRDGVFVGLWQALALIPGVSRSGSTITGALYAGFDRPTAARFSFLLSIPAVFLAGAYELYDERHSLGAMGAAPIIVATAVAFVVGYLSIDFLMRFLRRHTMWVFVIYRLALGILLLILLAKGILLPR